MKKSLPLYLCINEEKFNKRKVRIKTSAQKTSEINLNQVKHAGKNYLW